MDNKKPLKTLEIEVGFTLKMPLIPKLFDLFGKRAFTFDSNDEFLRRCRVFIKVSEIKRCPFCGKEVQNLTCDCKDFQGHISKLRSTLTCDKRTKIGFRSRHEGFVTEAISVTEVNPTKCDFKAEQVVKYRGMSYSISKPTYENDHLLFYVTENVSLQTFKCTLKYNPEKIEIGTWVPDGFHLIPENPTEKGIAWKICGRFTSWSTFCKMLIEDID